MTSPALPPDLESVSVCIPDHYGRLAGKRIAAHRFGEILAGGLDMPDFHLVTGPDNQPAAGVAATGDHTGFPNDVLWPDMETFRRLPWDPDSAIVLAQARRRIKELEDELKLVKAAAALYDEIEVISPKGSTRLSEG